MYFLLDRKIPVLNVKVGTLCGIMIYGKNGYRLNQDVPRSLQ